MQTSIKSLFTYFSVFCVFGIGLTSFDAHACGGLFCSAGQPSPVDQNAERILFEVHPPPVGITAVVEISYSGNPDAFSWIVPVPETPTLDVVPADTLQLLDALTSPSISAPPISCTQPFSIPFGFPDLSCDEELNSVGGGAGQVNVEDLPKVGAFEPEVISSEDPEALADWLVANGYLVTDAMRPFIAQYVDEGYKFLGLKLAADQGVQDITPIKFSCPSGDAPLIPIRLTSVSAEPEMGILTFVAADVQYAPRNYVAVDVPAEKIQFNYRTRGSNYFPLLSHLVDEAGGKAFVTQYARSTSALSGLLGQVQQTEGSRYLENLAWTFPYLTRMYTRMSGWEMDDDPVFGPAPDLAVVSGALSLRGRPSVELCGEEREENNYRQPCMDTYCGKGAKCGVSAEGDEGCICPEGTSAKRIDVPQLGQQFESIAPRQQVTCQSDALNILPTDEVGDACANLSCKGGTCLAINGFPTCRCLEGFVAIANNSPVGSFCTPAVAAYGPEQLDFEATGMPNLPLTSSGTFAMGPIGILFMVGILLRRRERR